MLSPRFFAVVCLLPALLQAGPAPEPKVLRPWDYREIEEHVLGSRPIVPMAWADMSKGLGRESWEFDLTINDRGLVTDAIVKAGPASYRAEAIRAAKEIRFKPFERDGRTVPARLTYYVQGQATDYDGPPERNFPPGPAPNDFRIALARSACFGTCPDYWVEIRADGEVTYRGRGYVLVKGLQHWRVDPAAVAGLIDLFRRADYLRLDGYYEINASDLPTYVTRVSIGSQRKFVLDYGGSGMGGAYASTSFGGPDPHMPSIVTELEDAVDSVAETASWVRGDEHTVVKLHAARWNFRSKQAGRALSLLVMNCKTDLARAFIQEGAPIEVKGEGLGLNYAILGAPSCADIDLVHLLESKGALAHKRVARSFLKASVASGYPEMVAVALRHNRDVGMTDSEGVPLLSTAAGAFQVDKQTHRALTFNSAAVVAMLVAAGADPNAVDSTGNTPLHEANSEPVARTLLGAGANPNARNAQGQTPLFNPYFEETKPVLLAAGADVTVRDNFGRTPLFEQQYADSARALIRAGVDVHAMDREGRTALESVHREEVALALVAAGANLPTDPGRLEAMIKRATEGRWTVLLPVLERAASARAEDSKH